MAKGFWERAFQGLGLKPKPKPIKDSSRWVVTLIRGLYKPHIGPLPLYEPYMNLIWGYPPSNYTPETVPETQGSCFSVHEPVICTQGSRLEVRHLAIGGRGLECEAFVEP